MILYQSGETQIWYYIIFAGAFHLRVDAIFKHCDRTDVILQIGSATYNYSRLLVEKGSGMDNLL